jgi:hypothetical protein
VSSAATAAAVPTAAAAVSATATTVPTAAPGVPASADLRRWWKQWLAQRLEPSRWRE